MISPGPTRPLPGPAHSSGQFALLLGHAGHFDITLTSHQISNNNEVNKVKCYLYLKYLSKTECKFRTLPFYDHDKNWFKNNVETNFLWKLWIYIFSNFSVRTAFVRYRCAARSLEVVAMIGFFTFFEFLFHCRSRNFPSSFFVIIALFRVWKCA